MILKEHHDPMGAAIWDYFHSGEAERLVVQSSMFEDDELPAACLFRAEEEMPAWERTALRLCRGRVLDIGAGAGCHSLVLQERGLDVTAIDISPLSVQTMRERGVQRAFAADVMYGEREELAGPFDTLLLLMNGLGISGRLHRLPQFLSRLKEMLAPDGQILADSSDIRYIYEDEDGALLYDGDGYYGEVDYRMVYGHCRGPQFHWLYVDFERLRLAAASVGLQAEMLEAGPSHEYLVRLCR